MSGDNVTLEARERGSEALGSANVRRLRRQGFVPGVLYGKGEPRAIVVGERDLRTALTGPSGLHAILDVVIAGQDGAHPSVLKDYQQHPVKGRITHFDLHEVRLDRPIQTSVSIQFVGESPGVKQGGILNQAARELTIEALPRDVPEHIEVDVSGLGLGDSLRLEDVPEPAGIRFLDNVHDTIVASVIAPRGTDAMEEGEGEEAPEGEAAESASADSPADEPAE